MMAAHNWKLCWPSRPLCFAAVVYFFFRRLSLRGRSIDRHQTLPHVRCDVLEFGRKFEARLTPSNLGSTQKTGNFATWSPKQNKITSNGKLCCKLRSVNLANVGLQTAKIRTGVSSTSPPGSHHAWHYHTFWYGPVWLSISAPSWESFLSTIDCLSVCHAHSNCFFSFVSR